MNAKIIKIISSYLAPNTCKKAYVKPAIGLKKQDDFHVDSIVIQLSYLPI